MNREPRYRVGIGTDVHRLAANRPLRLAGVEPASPVGPAAHSDGDVVLHALCDALAGAAGLPDIGELFPDSDTRWKDADSAVFVKEVLRLVRERGYSVGNVDIVVHLQWPKLSAHKAAMRERLAGLLGIPAECVNLKAKTGERLGAVGEGRAVECIAVVLLM